MKSLASSRTKYVFPALELVFAASEEEEEEEEATETQASGHGDNDDHDDDDCLYCLIVEYYEAGKLGLSDKDDNDGDGLK
jgi:hypothetical protein